MLASVAAVALATAASGSALAAAPTAPAAPLALTPASPPAAAAESGAESGAPPLRTELRAPLTLVEMLGELDAVAEILAAEFRQRRGDSAVREKHCLERGRVLEIDAGGISAEMNATRMKLVALNEETERVLSRQAVLEAKTSSLTSKVEDVGESLRATENDLVDAEKLQSTSQTTFASHKDRHSRNEAIVEELLGYVQKSKASMVTAKTAAVPALRLLERRARRLASLRGKAKSGGAPDQDDSGYWLPPTRRKEDTAIGAAVRFRGGMVGGDAAGEARAGVETEAGSVDKVEEAERSHDKLSSLLGEIKQTLADYAPTRAMSHEKLQASQGSLVAALKAKLTRLEHELDELRTAKLRAADQLRNAVTAIESVSGRAEHANHLLEELKLHLSRVQGHIAKHEKSCELLERKFEECKDMMLHELGIVKEIKLMLSAHQLKRAAAAAASLTNELKSVAEE